MAPRFDSDNLRLELAVADLIDASLFRHIGFGQRGGYERMWVGQAIHSRYQEQALARDPAYAREVLLSWTFEAAGFRVSVRGRADGVWRDADGTAVVEEVKSVRRGTPLGATARARAEEQLSLYGLLLARTQARPVRAMLVLIELGTDAVRLEPLELRIDALEARLRALVERLIAEFETDRAERSDRSASADGLRFPYPARRPVQDTIMAAVERALEERSHLLVQAPSGVGKTVAALYPALREALRRDLRVFVLTAKNTQQEMALQVLELLGQSADFRSVQLRAKARMCANEQMLCREEYCPHLRDFSRRLEESDAVERLFAAAATALPDGVYAAARQHQLCPFELQLAASRRSQVVVCDYNYVFDPYVALSDFAPEEDLSATLLVIDEVHNLLDRGREYYSPDLSQRRARQVADWAEAAHTPPGAAAAELCRAVADVVDRALADAAVEAPGSALARDEWAAEARLPEEPLQRLRPALDRAFIDYLEYRHNTRSFQSEDPFISFYFDFLRFLNGLLVSDSSFAHWVERSRDDARLVVQCRDPSRFLGGVLNRTAGAIGLSATLSPLDFYRDALGFDADRTASVVLPDPFPPENRAIVIDASVVTSFRERDRYRDRIAGRLSEFADAVPGNCLVLFPSYAFLEQIARRLAPSSKRVLVQRPDQGDHERAAILKTLREALFGDVLLLAVGGGVFAEGVDYPGDALAAVAVVGPCLPALTPERELLRAYYDEQLERGFEYAYVAPGLVRVLQAAGRLIRSERDRGVIALLGRRFSEPPYADYLPEAWLPPEGVMGLVGDPAAVARKFFAEG